MRIIVKNKLGEELERHETGLTSIHHWLCVNVEGYKDAKHHPISVYKNGMFVPFNKLNAQCSQHDEIAIAIEPQADPVTWYWIAVGTMFVSSAYLAYRAQQAAKDFQSPDYDGSSAYNSSKVSANTAKKDGVIREVFGKFNVYPDLINRMPTRRFEGFQEIIRMPLCIGAGYFDFPLGDIRDHLYIGDTPVDEYENLINVEVYGPGDSLPSMNTEFAIPALSIRYVGGGTVCSISIQHTNHLTNKKKLVVTVDASTYATFYMSSYVTVTSFAAAVDADPNLTCSVTSNGSVNPSRLLNVEISDIKTAARTLSLSNGALYIQYTGGSTSSLEIASDSFGAASLVVTGVGGDNIDLRLQDYATITDLVSYIDGLSAYTCSVSGSIGSLSPSCLQKVTSLNTHNIDNPTYLNLDPSFILQAQQRQPHDNWYSAPEAVNIELSDISTYPVKSKKCRILHRDDVPYFSGTPQSTGYTIKWYEDGVEITPLPFPTDSYIRYNGIGWEKINDASTGNSGHYKEESGSEGERALTLTGLQIGTSAPHSLEFAVNSLEIIDANKWIGGWSACPDGETTTGIEIEFAFPQGLFYIDGSGDKQEKEIVVYIKVESEDGGYLEEHSFFITETLKGNSGISKSIAFPYPIRPKVYVKRSTPDDFSANAASKVVVKEIKSLLSAAELYNEITTMTVEIYPAANEISRSSENKLNLRGITRKLPTRAQMEANYGLSPVATRSIATAAAYIVKEAIGGGAATNRIDWDALDDLDTTLAARSDFFDGEFSDETTLWEALMIIFKPGYSEPVIRDGKLSAIRFVEGSNFTQIFSPDVMLGDGLQIDYEFSSGIDADGVQVEYFDITQNGNNVVDCELTGDLFQRATRINAIGITDRDRAWRLGMRERQLTLLKPAMYTFSTELDGLNCEYGDPIAIASQWYYGCQSGCVTSVDGSTVWVDVDLEYTAPVNHYAVFRDIDGQFQGPYQCTIGPTTNRLILVSPSSLYFTPVTTNTLSALDEPWATERTMFAFGPLDYFYKRAIVRNVSQLSDSEVKITAEEYLEDLFLYDNDTAP